MALLLELFWKEKTHLKTEFHETNLDFLAHLYKVKECLCHTPGAHPGVCDQNVQFLCLGQLLSNYKGYRGFILVMHLHLGKTDRNQ